MLDKFKIKTYAWSNDVYFAGLEDYKKDCAEITGIDSAGKGDTSIIRARVTQDRDTFLCAVVLGGASGTVLGAQCTCPNRCDAFGYCRHVCCAMLTYLDQRDDPAFKKRKYSSVYPVGSKFYVRSLMKTVQDKTLLKTVCSTICKQLHTFNFSLTYRPKYDIIPTYHIFLEYF